MIKRLFALLLLGTMLVSLCGCSVFWGTDRKQESVDFIVEKKDLMEDPERHFMTHIEVLLRDINKMHRFWDRYFMNYDWDDPYIN